jgi:YVTN family beta-propeller protein
MIDVPGAPGFDSLAFAKGMLVMTHSSASAVDVFDPTRRRIVAHITGMQSPRGIAVDEANGKVYVADSGNNTIAVITTQDWKLADTIPVSGIPDALLLDTTGKMLYWSDAQNNTISLLDVTTRQNTGTVPLGGSPSHLVLDPDRNLVYVTLQDQREIVAVDPRLTIANHIKLNASQPTGMVYDPRTKCLYVAVRYAVLSINTDTGTEVNRVPAAAGVDMLWLDPESRTVYAAGSGALLMLRADGQRLTVADEISTDVKGHTVAYDPEKKMIVLPGGREGRSKLLLLRPMTPTAQDTTRENAEAKVR